MNPVTVILVFTIIWWMIFFMMLPVGVQAQHEGDTEIRRGTVPSAPQKPQLLRKALITTVITIILTGICAWLITSGILAAQFDLPY